MHEVPYASLFFGRERNQLPYLTDIPVRAGHGLSRRDSKMRLFSSAIATSVCAVLLIGQPAVAQDRAFAFSLTGGIGVAPSYFGSDSFTVAPSGSFGFTGLRFGATQWGDPDGARLFTRGMGVRGVFRYIPKRRGEDELAGLEDVKASLELGLGLHHTSEFWQVYGDLRYGVIGHGSFAGEIGANVLHRGASGLVLHAGPRAEFGSSRFMRTYFGITPAEASPSLAAYRPGGGLYSIGVEIGAYQPLKADWGITGSVRYDRLRGGAAASPIVRQGSRNQLSARIGLTQHFNLRF
jgi:MipA family protein